MRLLTHNTLRCNAKDVAKGYPLKLEVVDMNVQESEFSADFMKSMLPSLDWDGVLIAAAAIGFDSIPATLTSDLLDNEEFLRGCHNLLMDVHVTKGTLVCPESNRRFPIENGVPDMMLTEAEVQS